MPEYEEQMKAFIARGIALVHENKCPACNAAGRIQELLREVPLDKFHYHGKIDFIDPPYIFCHFDGQGYRVINNDLRILPPCNGGLHEDGTVGYR